MQNKFAAITMIMFVMIGMTGFAAAMYDSSVVLENKDSSWQPINDTVSATIDYNLAGDEFEYHAYGTAVGNMQYSLIYYADQPNRFVNWGGDNPGAMIGTITTLTNGSFDVIGSVDLDMNLPCTPDANMNISEHNYSGAPDYYAHATGAKLWMVPTAALPDPYPGDGAWAFWNTGGILFETDLITYDDCDLSITSPCQPANATIDVGDTFGGTVPITVTNATNVGSVDLTVSYNSSIVTVTGVTNGDMDVMGLPNIGTGYVKILAYQSGNPGLNGDFTLANLTFTAVGNETCDFVISVTSFQDATPCVRAMPYITGDGEYCGYNNGDVNGDGSVNAGDVMYLAKHILSITGYDTIIECASDVDGTEPIDSNDVLYLARYLIGITGYETLL